MVQPLRTNQFFYLNHNMQITIQAWSAKPTNPWIQTAHSIASLTLVPFLLIAAFEAVIKNGLFLVINSGVFLANQVNQLYKVSFSKPYLTG